MVLNEHHAGDKCTISRQGYLKGSTVASIRLADDGGGGLAW